MRSLVSAGLAGSAVWDVALIPCLHLAELACFGDRQRTSTPGGFVHGAAGYWRLRLVPSTMLNWLGHVVDPAVSGFGEHSPQRRFAGLGAEAPADRLGERSRDRSRTGWRASAGPRGKPLPLAQDAADRLKSGPLVESYRRAVHCLGLDRDHLSSAVPRAAQHRADHGVP